MKKLLFGLGILSLSLTSCNGALDPNACLRSVKKQFPKSAIYTEYTGSNIDFYVTDSTGVKLVRTGNFMNANVSYVILLKKVQ